MIRKTIAGLLALALAAAASAGALSFPPFMPPRDSAKPHPAIAGLRDYSATVHTNLGDMALAFEPDQAPNAVRNFIKLALQGAYDGTRFYGVFKGRMILAGDPTAKGTGDVGYSLDHEPTVVGHAAGALAMDTLPRDPEDRFAPQKNSGSRFFICVSDQRHLDGDYTVFARITKGLAVAERISAARTAPGDGCPAPVEEIVIERITLAKKAKEADPKPPDKETK